MEVTFSQRSRSIIVWVGVIAGFFLLLKTAHALNPFAWAVITAYLFHPLVQFIHRRTRLPKSVITVWLYLMVGLILVLLVINVAPSLVDQVKDLQKSLPTQFDRAQAWLQENQGDRLEQLGIDPNEIETRVREAATEFLSGASTEALPVVAHSIRLMIEFLIYLVASFYLIVYGDRFVQSFKGALNRRYHNEFDQLLTDINNTLGAYIRGQALLVVIMSVATFVALTILDVRYALILAIMTGFLELIPLIGPWSAGAIAVSVAAFQSTTPFGWTNLTLAIVVAIVYFILRQLEDTFVIPQVIGRIVHLHPLLVIFVVVAGTALGGILGLLLAVPIAAVLKILVQYFYAKVMARDIRNIERVASADELRNVASTFAELDKETLVLILEPGALAWEDLPLVQQVVEQAQENLIALSVVATDGVAGALFTAAGVPTETIPATDPAAVMVPA